MRWIADDVDPDDRAELQRVLAAALAGDPDATADLDARMAGPLRFGTAGLRGPLRAGPAGMNRAVVLRATAGLAAWLADRATVGTVVVGRDARHRSGQFARAAAEVFGAAGFDAVLLPEPLPTPVVAFAVRRLGAVAGVQITASHNPAGDNGYKVYVGGGLQLAPPDDVAIEAAIRAAPPAVAVPRAGPVREAGPELRAAYLDRVVSLVGGGAGGRRGLRVAATPLHGVGGAVLVEALRRSGVADPHLVAAQAEPDPAFPTVAFPNPEEPGAADAVLALAAEIGADLALALDPDADRCAVGVPDPDGGWRLLSGDETGVLLAEYLLAGRRLGCRTRDGEPPLVATSLVSGSLLGAVAADHGARYAQTRTGFKWLARAGAGLCYAYEEALGYCVDPDAVPDKDGVAAAVLLCEMAASGPALTDRLDALFARHGVHLTGQVALRLTDHAGARAVMARLRAEPPRVLAGQPVRVEDLLHHPDLPDDTLVLRAGDTAPGARRFQVLVRPSGTEPKLKAYLEVIEPVPGRAAPTAVGPVGAAGPAEVLGAAKAAASQRLAALRAEVTALLEGLRPVS